MAMTADQLPDDPDALKAMVLARDVENARLIQIIKELQRHRFGRRAETLPEDQLLLGLGEAEQIEAAGEEAAPRRPLQTSDRQRLPNAGPTVVRCRRICLAWRWSSTLRTTPARAAASPPRIGEDVERAARHRSGAAARDRCAPAQICLPRLRGRGGSGSRARPADREWSSDRGDGRPGAGLQICRSSAALSVRGADLYAPRQGHQSRSLPRSPTRVGRAAPGTCVRCTSGMLGKLKTSPKTLR